MKRYWIGLFALACLLGLTACGRGEGSSPAAAEDEFIVTVVCESKEISQVGYSAYIGGEYRTMGRGAELDKGLIPSGCTLEFHFSANDFQDGDDIQQFSMTLSPYGKDGEEAAAATEPVSIAAEYGKNYTINLSGDREKGFAADLNEV